jgi:hypothetical protein
MIDPPFRSPRERVGGLYYFGRILDKIRCHLREKLPEEYRSNFGLSVCLDGMLCGMLGVAHADLIERMRGGGKSGRHRPAARPRTRWRGRSFRSVTFPW